MASQYTTEGRVTALIVAMQTRIDISKTDGTSLKGMNLLGYVVEETSKKCRVDDRGDLENACYLLNREIDNVGTPIEEGVVDKEMLALLVKFCEETMAAGESEALKTRLVGFFDKVDAFVEPRPVVNDTSWFAPSPTQDENDG